MDPRGRPTFHGHEVLGSRRADAVLRRLRVARAQRRRVVRLVLLHLRPGHLADAGSPQRGLRRLVRDAGTDLPLLTLHAACDAKSHVEDLSRWRRLRRVLELLIELWQRSNLTPLPRLADGHDVRRILRIDAGPGVGSALRRLRQSQEDGRVLTRRQALRFLAELRRDSGAGLDEPGDR